MRYCNLLFLLLLFTSWVFCQETVSELKREIQQMKSHYNQEIQKLRSELKAVKEQPKKMEQQLGSMVDKYLQNHPSQGGPSWSDLVSPKNRIKFYGFIRLDMIYDSHRTNNGNFAFFVNNHAPSPSGQDDELNIHARLTRLGLNINGGKLAYLGGPEVSGKIEIDFFGGGSESRNLPRMRHAYLKLNWREYDLVLLAGQTSDLASPLYPHSIDWNAIQWNMGNTGDRRPQLRLSYNPSIGKMGDEDIRLSFEAAILRTEAVGGQDIDGDGNNDGEDSGAPMIQWRLGLNLPAFVDNQPIRFGIWGSHGWEESQSRLGARAQDDFKSHLIGADLTLPLHDRVFFQAEGWWGSNVNDLRGGIGQGINTITGKPIEAVGGWASMKIKLLDMLSMSFGGGFDNPYDEDVADFGGRRFNSFLFVNNVWDLGSGVSFGYEYEYLMTYYNRRDRSNYGNRAIAYLMYKF